MEQNRYILFSRTLSATMRGMLFMAAIILTAGLTACVPTGKESVNTELFKDKEDLKTRAAALKPGMARKTVFENLNIAPEQFERMSMQDVQMSIYGNSQVTGSPEQLENFKQRMMAYEGYALPYRAIEKDSSLGFGTMKVHKQGSDLRLVVIFEHGKLLRASVEGSEQVNSEEDQYLWGSLISKGIGLAF